MVARFVGLTSTFDEQRQVINEIADDVDSILSDYATESYVDSSVSGLSTFSGNYNDLTNKPQIPIDVADLSNSVGFVTSGSITGFLTSGSLVGYITSGYVDNSVVGFLTSGSLVGYITSGYVDNSVVGFLTSGSLVGYVDEAFVLNSLNDYVNAAVVGFITTGYVDTTVSNAIVGLDDYSNLINAPWQLDGEIVSTEYKVGIGSTIPNSNLDVSGSVDISGGINVVGVITASDINDSKGDLRNIPQNSQGSLYTLSVSDSGKHVSTAASVTVPPSVFSIGDAVTIYNSTDTSITISPGSGVTMRQAGTANVGIRTLSQYGLSTILCVSNNVFVISGGGLS
jgi:hypothetical protein